MSGFQTSPEHSGRLRGVEITLQGHLESCKERWKSQEKQWENQAEVNKIVRGLDRKVTNIGGAFAAILVVLQIISMFR